MKTILASLMCMGAMTILSGCGGGSGASGGASACGGAIQGTWNITSSNITIDVSMVDQDCPAATGTGSGITLTGTAMYNADMTYTEMATYNGTLTVNVPTSCIAPGGVSCAAKGGMLMGDTFQTATCATTASGCTCMLTFAPTPMTDTGTYTTTAAGLLTETSAGQATTDESDYCVKGTTLTETPHAGSGISGSIVLAKP